MDVQASYENHVLAHPRNILDHLDGFGYGRTGNRIYHTIQVADELLPLANKLFTLTNNENAVFEFLVTLCVHS